MFKFKQDFLQNLNLHYLQEGFIDFEIEVKMFCGSECISNGFKLNWKGRNNNLTALFNRTLKFDIRYCDLPIFSSLIIKFRTLVQVEESKNKKEIEKKTVAWINFRLFDHSKLLKTGIHKWSLWNTKFSDDSYFISSDNDQENTGEIYFELESFTRPVEHQNHNEDLELYRPEMSQTSQEDQKILEKVVLRPPYQELTDKEKLVIWINRNAAIRNPKLIPRLFSCIDKTDFREVDILEKLVLVKNF